MKTSIRAAALAACVAAAFLPATAFADATDEAPVITIVSPTGIVYVSSFPTTVPVVFTVSHSTLDKVNVLRVNAAGTIVPDEVSGNPFNETDCTPQVFTKGYTSCTVALTVGTLGFNWGIPAPGDYTLVISAKNTNDLGDDSETVTFALLSVEYPAPPAIANAYINLNYKKIKPTARGCVISAIAQNHAHDSKYGPKGGPYNDALVHSDVEAYRPGCN